MAQFRGPGSATAAIAAEIRSESRRLGFDLCGITPAVTPPAVERFEQWLSAGYAGEMHYLSDRTEAYNHPRHVLDGARSIVMLAMNYRSADPSVQHEPIPPGSGRISRYAWGTDYHEIIRDRLNQLADWLREQVPTAQIRGVVDTAPLLEREFAQLAGLGWIGKNTLMLNKQIGSWFFLAALLTDIELAYDQPFATDHCGSCRACLDACPTDAFVAPYVLDARRCISYLTIELRDAIPHDLRSGIGDWLFGCDICQDVCPWNRGVPVSDEPAFQPLAGTNPIELTTLFDLDETAFKAKFRHSPLWRAKRRGLLRNAATVLGNQPHSTNIPALAKGLNDDEPLVRGACAWALGNHRDSIAFEALARRHHLEPDLAVRGELQIAMDRFGVRYP